MARYILLTGGGSPITAPTGEGLEIDWPGSWPEALVAFLPNARVWSSEEGSYTSQPTTIGRDVASVGWRRNDGGPTGDRGEWYKLVFRAEAGSPLKIVLNGYLVIVNLSGGVVARETIVASKSAIVGSGNKLIGKYTVESITGITGLAGYTEPDGIWVLSGADNDAGIEITTSSPLTATQEETAVSITLAASGGTTPYYWYVSSGTLPSGITLSSSGVLSGTTGLTSAGSYSFNIRAISQDGLTATKSFTWTVAANNVSITTSSPLSDLYDTTAVSFQFAASGSTSPYTWSVVSGSLPTGLSLSSGGLLTGTPTHGDYSFTLRATSSTGKYAEKAFTSHVVAVEPSFGGGIFSFHINSSPTSGQLSAGGGISPYTYSKLSGAGVTITSSGKVYASSTPGTYTANVRCTGANGAYADAGITIFVNY